MTFRLSFSAFLFFTSSLLPWFRHLYPSFHPFIPSIHHHPMNTDYTYTDSPIVTPTDPATPPPPSLDHPHLAPLCSSQWTHQQHRPAPPRADKHGVTSEMMARENGMEATAEVLRDWWEGEEALWDGCFGVSGVFSWEARLTIYRPRA